MVTPVHTDRNRQYNIQKSIANILKVKSYLMSSLCIVPLRKWYNSTHQNIMSYHLQIPMWDNITKYTIYITFCGNRYDKGKTDKLFMFLFSKQASPPSPTIENTRNKITCAKERNSCYVLYQLIMQNHPDFLDMEDDNIWQPCDATDSLNTYILTIQLWGATEKQHGHVYSDIEILCNLYKSLPDNTVPQIRLFINEAVQDYSDRDQSNISERWRAAMIDTTIPRQVKKYKKLP